MEQVTAAPVIDSDKKYRIVPPNVLIDRANALVPEILDRQNQTEANRCVSDEIFGKIQDAELHKVLLPRRYGGFEHGLDTYAKVAFEIARGCGSTGWVSSILINHLLLAMFPPEAQEDVWGTDSCACTAEVYVPTGIARPIEDGYKLTGNWKYCSGIDNSPWVILAVDVASGSDTQTNEKGFVLAPASDFEIEDNWQVAGLAGTGSKNINCDDLFVPAYRFLRLEDTMTGHPPGEEVNNGDVYRVPLFAQSSVSLCSPIMGMAQGAFDEFVGSTRERVTRGSPLSGPSPVAEFSAVQLGVGEAAACIDSARLLVDRDCKDIMNSVAVGGGLTVEQRARNKGDLGFAAQLATRAVDKLLETAGAGALFNENRLQRFWRDVHAGAAQISMRWSIVGALYGRVTLGLPAGPAQF
jgi:alkylation response protein AidB-like acyl-CoA dehydrogenase